MTKIKRRLGLAAALVVAGGCAPVINLPEPTAPRFLGAYASLHLAFDDREDLAVAERR